MDIAFATEPHALSSMTHRNPPKIISFSVAGRMFGVDVAAVREIRGWQPTTPLPNTSPHVLGVINLRGEVTAIFDLRARLELPPASDWKSTVVIVVDLGDRFAGLVADSVSDILDVELAQYRPPPDAGVEHSPVLSIILRPEALISLLDVNLLTRG